MKLSISKVLITVGFATTLAGCSSSGSGKDAGNALTADEPDSGGAMLGDCTSASITPCSSFTTPTGTHMDLGPLGAIMEVNVGQDFANNDVAAGDNDDGTTCKAFAESFKEDPDLTAQLLNTTRDGVTVDFNLYTVYRPVKWEEGKKYPVLTWGNGTCAQPEGYGALLRYIASYGFFIVAANDRYVGGATEMLHALDFAAAANADASSPYYGKLDMTKVGAMGHSQGGGGTVAAAEDPRVKAVIIFNAATSATKPFLAISGDLDIFNFTSQQMAAAVQAAPEGAYLFYHNPAGQGPLKGHLVLMLTPERVAEPSAAWWRTVFNDDAEAKKDFVGDGCGLCGHSEDYDFGENGL